MERIIILYNKEYYPHRNFDIIDICYSKKEFFDKYGFKVEGGITGYQFKRSECEPLKNCEPLNSSDKVNIKIIDYDGFFTKKYKEYLKTQSNTGKLPTIIQNIEKYLNREIVLKELSI